MGFDIGMAAAAFRGYKDAEKDELAQEDLAKRRSYDEKVRAAGLDMMPDRAANERAQLQLQTAQNQAGLELQTARAKLASSNLNLEQSAADFKATQQPMEQATAATNNKVAEALAQFSVDELPNVIARKKREGVFSDADAGTATVAKLADLVTTGDSNSIIKFLNGIGSISGGKPVAKVGMVKNDKGENVLVALGADDQPVMQVSAKQMTAVRNSIGKTESKVLNGGQTLVTVKNGVATPQYTAPADPNAANNKRSEMELQFKFLTGDPAGPMMPKEAATEFIRKGSHKTPEERFYLFQQELVKAAAGLGKKLDQQEINRQAAALSGYAPGQSTANGLQNAPGSNTKMPSKLNPQVNSLLGIPNSP